ncbi:MAG: PEP-CTERM sorting domain-containing protein [Planctomycetota bacterium]|nr:MAG: PEP-CTERM sorting domain-containing protein [Planctomycetota bacterium]
MHMPRTVGTVVLLLLLSGGLGAGEARATPVSVDPNAGTIKHGSGTAMVMPQEDWWGIGNYTSGSHFAFDGGSRGKAFGIYGPDVWATNGTNGGFMEGGYAVGNVIRVTGPGGTDYLTGGGNGGTDTYDAAADLYWGSATIDSAVFANTPGVPEPVFVDFWNYFDDASGLAAQLVSFRHQGAAGDASQPVNLTASWNNHFFDAATFNGVAYNGSDRVTTGDGDNLLETGDVWAMADDTNPNVDLTVGARPTAAFVWGNVAPALLADTVVFRTQILNSNPVAYDQRGIRADYSFTLGKGQTVSLLYFTGGWATRAAALADLARFQNLRVDDPLVSWIGNLPYGPSLDTIANWQFASVGNSAVPEPATWGLVAVLAAAVSLARRGQRKPRS